MIGSIGNKVYSQLLIENAYIYPSMENLADISNPQVPPNEQKDQ